jgi:type I restriction enzyme R subunit
MRGRGTRTAPHIGKTKFVIYDFFGNHDYFNDSDTDIFTGAGGGHAPSGERKPPKTFRDLVEVGPEGERVDKLDFVTNLEKTVRSSIPDDRILQKIRDDKPQAKPRQPTLFMLQPQQFLMYYFNSYAAAPPFNPGHRHQTIPSDSSGSSARCSFPFGSST